ncbi:sigma factor [Haliangium sp.]|uniref:sigma factor n=1 Tax=Haliangium sp. TaxID=2663208 RepID=UPI003D0C82BF
MNVLLSAHHALCVPLTDEEQADVLSRAQAGDAPARERLVCSFARLVQSRINRAAIPRGIDREDLFAEGMAAVVRGLDRFDIGKGVTLCSFLVVVIDRAVWRAINRALPMSPRTDEHPRVESLVIEDPDRPWASHNLVDPGAGPDAWLELVEARDELERVLSGLDPREESVIRVKFGLLPPAEHDLPARACDSEVTRERLHQLEALAVRASEAERQRPTNDEEGTPPGRGSYYSKVLGQQATAAIRGQGRLFDPNPSDNG